MRSIGFSLLRDHGGFLGLSYFKIMRCPRIMRQLSLNQVWQAMNFHGFTKCSFLKSFVKNVNPYSIPIKAMVGKKQNWEDKKNSAHLTKLAKDRYVYEYAFIRMRINSDNSGTSRTI